MLQKVDDNKDRKQVWIHSSSEMTVNHWSQVMGISKKLAASVLIEIGNEIAKDNQDRFLEIVRRFTIRRDD